MCTELWEDKGQAVTCLGEHRIPLQQRGHLLWVLKEEQEFIR